MEIAVKKYKTYSLLCLILGLIGMFLGLILVGWLFIPPSIIFGVLALNMKLPNVKKGKIVVGFICSGIGVLIGVGMLASVIATPTVETTPTTNTESAVQDITTEINTETSIETHTEQVTSQESTTSEIETPNIEIETPNKDISTTETTMESVVIENPVEKDSDKNVDIYDNVTNDIEPLNQPPTIDYVEPTTIVTDVPEITETTEDVNDSVDDFDKKFKSAFWLFISGVVMLICSIGAASNRSIYKRLENVKPTPMICPICKSDKINVTVTPTGINAIPIGGLWVNSISNKKVAVCQSCGHDFSVITKAEIDTTYKQAKSKWTVECVILLVALWVFFINMMPFAKTTNHKTATTTTTTNTSDIQLAEEFNTTEFETDEDTYNVLKYQAKLVLFKDIQTLTEDGYNFYDIDDLASFAQYSEGTKILTIANLEHNSYSYGETGFINDNNKVSFYWDSTWSAYFNESDDYKVNEEHVNSYKNVPLLISGTIEDYGYIKNCQILSNTQENIDAVKDLLTQNQDTVLLETSVLDKFTTEAEEFKGQCEEVSYSDLKRNPDLYKSKKIKVTIKITRVDADGWIMQGTQLGIMEGKKANEVAISDDRTVRMPRFVEGDKLVFYGYGDGTRTMKGAGVGGTISDVWTGDSGYEIPCVKVLYTDNDNYEDWVTVIRAGDNDSHIAR